MKRVPIVVIALLTALSGGSAFALNLALGRLVEVPPVAEGGGAVASARSDAPPPRPRALGVEQYLDGIMGRNLFDVTQIGAWAARNPGAGGGSGVVRTELRVKLLGTIVANPDVYSSALILDEDSKDLPRAYSLGDTLHDREVVAIEKDRVGLKKGDGSIEWVTMGEGAVSRTSDATADADDEAEGITETGDGRYAIDRAVFDKYISDLEGISRMGRALLHRGPDGEYDGYRLSAIRRGTLADKLGIKNGDIIQSVNGQALTSPQAALNAYNTMRSESSFCFDLNRRGQTQQLCYDVR